MFLSSMLLLSYKRLIRNITTKSLEILFLFRLQVHNRDVAVAAVPLPPLAASDAPASGRRSRGGEMTSPEPVLKQKPDAVYDTPPVEKRRCSGKGGFVSSAPSLDTQRSVLPRLSENSLYNNAIAAARFGSNSGRAFADRDLFLR